MNQKNLRGILKRVRKAVALASITMTLIAWPAGAATGHQSGNVYDLQQGLIEITDARAVLGRGMDDLTFTVDTSGLHGGDAYTVWWIVFNHPEFCSNPLLPALQCGIGDLHFPEFRLEGDPRVEATIVYATGHVVGRNGRSGFGGHLKVGDMGNEVIGDGLTNAMGAEVIIDILDHGAKDPRNVPNQIHEFVAAENSCNPACADHQLVGFGL